MNTTISLNLFVELAAAVLVLYFGWSLRTGLIRVVIPLLFFVVGFGFAYVFDESKIDDSLSFISIAVLFCGLVFGYFARYFYDVGFGAAVAKKGAVKAARLLLLDFRVVAVFIGLLISILMAFPFYNLAVHEAAVAAEYAQLNQTPPGLPGFWLSFYTAWVSSVLFFAVVGLVVGLTALYRPEADVFAARVKILLGGKSGPAVDYIAKKLGEIGYVARLTQRKIVVEGYSEQMKAFRVRVVHSTWVKNLYHDVQTDASGKISFNMDDLTPPPSLYGELSAFRINGVIQPDLPAPLPRTGFTRPWNFGIPGGEEGVLTYEHWGWYREDKDHNFSLGRFTEILDVEIKARCSVKIKVIFTVGTQTDERVLGYDEELRVAPIVDRYPGTATYSFKLAADSTSQALNLPQSDID